jgi:hypothetical protein
MSSLLVQRPPGRRMHDDEAQGSLFGGDAFAPPQRPAPVWRRPAPVPVPAPEPEPLHAAAPTEEVVDDAGFAPPEDAGASYRVSRATLAGPTLDDAVTHAWEALVAGVPAACPVCHAEIEPALTSGLQGHCGSCHVTLD